jgi:hypothetical protein
VVYCWSTTVLLMHRMARYTLALWHTNVTLDSIWLVTTREHVLPMEHGPARSRIVRSKVKSKICKLFPFVVFAFALIIIRKQRFWKFHNPTKAFRIKAVTKHEEFAKRFRTNNQFGEIRECPIKTTMVIYLISILTLPHHIKQWSKCMFITRDFNKQAFPQNKNQGIWVWVWEEVRFKFF